MKRLIRVALLLYPASWRRRYGGELEALVGDLKPQWRVFLDVLAGAFVMQIRTFGTLPVRFVLIGALCGAAVTWFKPHVYASSSTVRFDRQGEPATESMLQERLQESLSGVSTDIKNATDIRLLDNASTQTTLQVTYLNRDAAEAQRVVQSLTAAVAASGGPTATASVIAAPSLPAAPVPSDYLTPALFGSLIGALVSVVLFVVKWSHSLRSA